MTIDELKQRGYVFRVSHAKHEVCCTAAHDSPLGRAGFTAVAFAPIRADAVEAMRMAAVAHFVAERLV